MAPLGELGGDRRVDLGPLAGEDEELLGVAALRLVETPLDLVRSVDVRLVRREGAVLAVALAGAREGERVVPREGDPAHDAQATASMPPPDRSGPAAMRLEDASAQAVLPAPGFGALGFGAPGGLTRSGGSVGAGPPGSSTNLKTTAASSAPTIGPTR